MDRALKLSRDGMDFEKRIFRVECDTIYEVSSALSNEDELLVQGFVNGFLPGSFTGDDGKSIRGCRSWDIVSYEPKLSW